MNRRYTRLIAVAVAITACSCLPFTGQKESASELLLPISESEFNDLRAQAEREYGRGDAKWDDETYVEELRARAEGGDADAQFVLGVGFFNGRGVAQDQGQAVYWWEQAAKQGVLEAQVNLGYWYRDGRVPTGEELLQWCQVVAGYHQAQFQQGMGHTFEDGFGGVLQDEAAAARWFRCAAEHDYSMGMLNLGRLYQEGVGVAQDDMTAYIWLNLAVSELSSSELSSSQSTLNYAIERRDSVAARLTQD